MNIKFVAAITTLTLLVACTPVEQNLPVVDKVPTTEPAVKIAPVVEEPVTVIEPVVAPAVEEDAVEQIGDDLEEAGYTEEVTVQPYNNTPLYIYASDLSNKFFYYPVEMEAKYGESVISLHGMVDSIDNYSDGAALLLNGSVIAVGDETFRNQLAGYSKNESIKLWCYGAHDANAGYPKRVIAPDCRVQ